MKYPRRLLLLAVIALLPATPATTGSVLGVLKDPTGMAIAGGTVTLADKARGKSLTATSDRKGSYGFRAILPGTYQVHAEASGFAPQDSAAFAVHVDSVVRVDLVLQPASK
jgi:hypothetical protein